MFKYLQFLGDKTDWKMIKAKIVKIFLRKEEKKRKKKKKKKRKEERKKRKKRKKIFMAL